MRWLLLFVLTLPLNADAGGAVGNGGDTVHCTANLNVSPFNGWYNLDYLINKTADVQFSHDFEKVIGPGDAYDKNFLRIMAAFKEKKYKILYLDLKEFYDGIWTNVFGQRYMWKKAPYGVVDLQDERLRQRIPPNCLGQSPQTSVIQTVLRTQKDWQMRVPNEHSRSVKGADFTYSTEIVSKLSGLQLSFLLFHEWLRNFTDNPELIRDANAIFHSQGWTEDDIDKKLNTLVSIGLHRLQDLRLGF
ncbi:MAG: hypothetical protein SGJ18_07075 [Pseudomonadota bacterium]|mgnify:CR=1 FL=1|nr:hypothetical protein [Pseudomonadota bacterium]